MRAELACAGALLLLVLYAGSLRKRSPQSALNVGRVPPLHHQEVEKICQAIEQGESLLIIGEQGSGKSTIAAAVKTHCDALFRGVAIASYSGSIKPFLISIGRQLKIELTKPKINSKGEEVGESPMSVDEMKDEIACNLTNNLLIIDDAHRLPTSLKLWIEEIHKTGNQLILLSITDPAKGIFLRLGKLELPQPTELQIRDIMQREAIALNLSLSPSRLAALQRRAGKNLMLCKKVIRDEAMGISSGVEHRDYIDISPFIMAALSTLAIVRFVGLGLGDRTIYIVGGVSMALAWSFKYIGQGMTRNRKRLGA
ncbi:MAG TPA: AAA family ATPase [Kamptonema sp.]|nr:AAA family ATPase [Kamptonema sp.]